MKRLGEIELMRFLTAIIVLLCHSTYYTGCVRLAPGGRIGVEFFFLLSGYLMAAHIQKQPSATSTSALFTATYQYLWHRLIAFWPELLFACCMGLIVFSWGHHFAVPDTLLMAHDTLIGNVLLLHMTAIAPCGVNGPVWYLSSLMLSSAILYPLFRKYAHSPIWPVMALVLLGYSSHANGSSTFLGVREWLGWTYKGNLRALAELTLGFSLYPLVQYLASKQTAQTTRLLLTLSKWTCYAVALLYSLHPIGRLAPLTLLALVCSLVLCFSRLCCDRTWYQHEWIFWLGKFSLPLYLSHIFWSRNLGTILPWIENPWGKLLVYVSLSLMTALAVMALAKQFRRITGCLFPKQKADPSRN